ncbi:hypothetical protein HT136_12405 [Novosphingobium profundi]|uniref:CmcJ/NvfI family oxidoreductase n=1 Tax=Novosphingobium profundi TaxID=1774954 RepID=UPI001BD91BA1|nr:CmcJ/NvfI family oxidoreductase [Novosphingobium profundi]MBT0669164.1 hypothetical protein [Novosphingobium profundi]
MNATETMSPVRQVQARLNYAVDSGATNRFHAINHDLDTFAHDAHQVAISNARSLTDAPSLEREGFMLADMPTRVRDFRDSAELERTYFAEVIAFIAGLSNADATVLSGPPALRFGEKASARDRSSGAQVARLVHSDTYKSGTQSFTEQCNPHPERTIARTVHHNIWRTFSPPPQDLPLALCDFRSVAPTDIIGAEAAFDNAAGEVIWTFEAMLFAFNPAHRWFYWPDMSVNEALVFKRYDSDPTRPWFVPHTAFEDPTAPADAPARASVEMRTISYWYE